MKNFPSFLLLSILVFGFVLRIYGISFGLPALFRYDEITYVETALRFGTFDFDPQGFTHGSLLKYILFFEYVIVYFILFLFRLVSSPTEFLIEYYIANPTLLFLVGRVTQVLLGLGSIFTTYLIGRKLFNRRVGLISAYFLSISFLHIQLCHYVKADILCCFLLTLVCLFAAKAFKDNERFLILAGLFVGLAMSAKYYAVFGYVFLLPSLIQRRYRTFLIASAMVIIGFFIGQPYAFLAPKKFIGDIINLSTFANYDFGQRGVGKLRLLFYLEILRSNIGLPILICSFLALFKKDFKRMLLFSFPACFTIFVLCNTFVTDRYLMPIIPFLTILSAISVDYFLNKFRVKSLVIITAIIVCFSLPMINIIRFSVLASSIDTRTIAKAWVEKNIPPHSKIAIEGAAGKGEPLIFWGPNIKSNLETLYDDYKNTIAKGGKGRLVQQRIKYLKKNPDQITYRLYKKSRLTGEFIERMQPEYVILCGYYNFWDVPKPLCSKNHLLLYKRIENRYKIIKKFEPYPELKWDYHFQVDYEKFREINLFNRSQEIISGPTIYIYKKI